MEEHGCTKEAEIATLKAHLEASVEARKTQYEDLKEDLKSVLVILRGDGNGNAGLVPRMGKVEERIKTLGIVVLAIIGTLGSAGIIVKVPWSSFIGG